MATHPLSRRTLRVILFLAAAPLAFLLWLMAGPSTASENMRPESLTTSTTPPACVNDLDDDSDGKRDYPDDPGCDEGDDLTEYAIEVETTSSLVFRPRSGVLRGRLLLSVTSPRIALERCVVRRVSLYRAGPGRDALLHTTRTRDDGTWRVAAGRTLSAAFYVHVSSKYPWVKWRGETIRCIRGRSERLPVFTDAPIIHPYCEGKPATLAGTDGRDVLEGHDVSDWTDVIVGFEGDDSISGADGADILCGGPGHDALDGGRLNDVVVGDAGNDELLGGDSQLASNCFWSTQPHYGDILVPGPGDDEVDGGEGMDLVSWSGATTTVAVDLGNGTATGEGTDVLISAEALLGSDHDDTLIGSPSVDTIFGGLGEDHVEGLDGDDCLFGSEAFIIGADSDGGDLVSGGEGDDTIEGGSGADRLFGDEDTDFVIGGDGDDEIGGGDGDDRLLGHAGDDIVAGDSGDDILAGEIGDDELDGGPGNDRLDGEDGFDHCVNGETVENCESP